jgi:hypothetical protein
MRQSTAATAQLRAVECWLPLAQEVRQTQAWRCDGATLQTLIVRALPLLARACSSAEARAILHRVYLDHQEQGS